MGSSIRHVIPILSTPSASVSLGQSPFLPASRRNRHTQTHPQIDSRAYAILNSPMTRLLPKHVYHKDTAPLLSPQFQSFHQQGEPAFVYYTSHHEYCSHSGAYQWFVHYNQGALPVHIDYILDTQLWRLAH